VGNGRRGRPRRIGGPLGAIYPLAVSGGSAGREPGRTVSVADLVDCWWRHHEVSMPTAIVGGAGRCFGWQLGVQANEA